MTRLALVLLLALAPAALARGYKPGLTHRPRLTFDGRDAGHIGRVRDRIHARTAPWAALYEELRDLAETGRAVPHGQSGWAGQPDKWAVLYGREVGNGQVARAKAAIAWLGAQGVDPAWRPLPKLPGDATPRGWLRLQAREAGAIVEGLYDRFPGWRGWGVLNRGIVSAESLLVHAQAWDLLAGLPVDLKPRLDAGKERLGRFAEDHQVYAPLLDPMNSNHPIRVDAGLGAAGIALNDLDRYRWWKPWTWFADTKDWVRRAERELDAERRGSNLRHVIGAGSYAEGTAYHAYSEAMYAPFFLAYVRSDGSEPLRQSPRLEQVERWSVGIRLPDGQRPGIDNGGPSSLLAGGFLANRLGRGSRSPDQRRLLAWDWLDQGAPRGGRTLELLAAYDPLDADAVAVAGMVAPAASAFAAEAGTATLRSGGGRGDAWALLMAEHGDARTNGHGHEDADALALSLFAEGDHLALDPGYAGWPNVGKTHAAEHHSSILVDGEGPTTPRKLLGFLGWRARGEDALLEAGPRTFHSPRVQSAAARSAWEGMKLRRTTSLVLGRALVIADDVEPDGRARDHDVTVLFHANGGGKKQGPAALTPLGLTFASHRRAAPVEVATASTRGAPRLDLGRAYDAMGGAADEHAVLRATIRARAATLLTVACWGPPGAAPRAPVKLLDQVGATALGVGQGTTVVCAFAQEGNARLVVPATAWTPRLESDARLLIVALDAGVVKAVIAHDARVARVGDGANVLELTLQARGTIRHEP